MVLQLNSDLDLIAIERERRRRLATRTATRTATQDFKTIPAHDPVTQPVTNVNPFQDKFTPSSNVKPMAEIAAEVSPQGKTGLGFGEKLARGAAAIPLGLAGAAESAATKPVETAVGLGKGIIEHAAETAALASTKAPGAVPELAVARLALKGAAKLKVPIIGDIEAKLQELEGQRLQRYKEDPIQAPMDVLGMIGLPATAAWAIKASKVLKAAPARIAEVLAENATKRAEAVSGKVAAQRERAFTEIAQEYDPTITKDDAKQWIDAVNEYDKQAGSTVGQSATPSQKAPEAPPANDLKAQIDAIVPKDQENGLAKVRKDKITSTQPADAGGAGTPGKSALAAESAPASAGEGGALNNSVEKPPTAEKITAPEPDAIGLNKAQIEKIRKAVGLDELPEVERRTHLSVLEKAKENGVDRRAMGIAKEIKENPRPLSDEEHAGMLLKIEELHNAFKESVDAVEDAVNRGLNPKDAQARMRVVEDEINLLTDASDSGGREAARSMSARRMLKSLEDDSIVYVRRQATATKGSKLTPEESAHFDKVVAEKDAALKHLEEVNAKWQKDYEELQEKQAAALIEHETKRAAITEKIKKKREKIASERVDILKQLRERGFETKLNAGLDPQDAFLIGKLGMNYVKGGITNIEEVVRLVMADVPNLTRRDVLQSLNSKNPDLQAKAKAAAMIQVNRLKKQAELLVKIEDAENGVFSKSRKATDTTPAEIKALQTKLRELRLASYQTIRDADRLERIQRTITDVQGQLQGHYRSLRSKKPTDTESVAALRDKLKDLRRQMTIEDELARLEDQLRTGDFEVPESVKPRQKSETLDRAEIDLKRARRVIRDEIEKLRPKSAGEKILRTSENLRAIKATADLSATLRQGAISVVSHPITAAKNFVPSLKAAFSQFKAEQIDMAMRTPDAQYLRDKAKLELTNIDGTPTTREEHFAGVWIEKIPALGEVVKASNRHMATFLNLMRTSIFDDFVRKVPNATTEELQAYARWINVTTGRGELGKYAQAGRSLGTVFFAPRFAVSRIQTPYVFYKSLKASPRVRAQVAKEAVAVGSTAMAVLALAKMSGAEVGTDPRTSDFGKIRIGNERIDIFAGFQQPMRLIVQSGAAITDRAGLTGQYLRDQDKEFDPIDAWMQFAEFKLSPMFTTPAEIIFGKNRLGEDVKITDALINSVEPMVVNAIREAWKEEGAGTAIRSGALNFMGVSSNVYPDSQTRLRRDIAEAQAKGDKATSDAKRKELNELLRKKNIEKREDERKEYRNQ